MFTYSYLNNRSFAAVHGNSEPSKHHILSGVPHCPILVKIYLNDIPSTQNDNEVAISLYADV